MASFLVLRSYLRLIQFDVYLARQNFEALYQKVRRFPVSAVPVLPGTIERACLAVDMASIWYWKEALCLQRSAATVCLLRAQGIHAQLVLGTQQMPFKAHAWAEVGGRIVNDKPYMREMYAVLDKC